MRRGSPASAFSKSAKLKYFSVKISGSARRKRYMDCFTSPTIKRFFPSLEMAEKMLSCTRLTS